MRFEITHKVTAKDSTNTMYAGQHWSKRKATADYWHCLVSGEMKRQLPKHIHDKPVMITISYNSGLDVDNHSGMSKMIIDSLKGYLIHDDTKKYVRCLVQKFHYADKDKIIVEITEV
jgi:Holliday junction resolvase RusA-like endonuclease